MSDRGCFLFNISISGKDFEKKNHTSMGRCDIWKISTGRVHSSAKAQHYDIKKSFHSPTPKRCGYDRDKLYTC